MRGLCPDLGVPSTRCRELPSLAVPLTHVALDHLESCLYVLNGHPLVVRTKVDPVLLQVLLRLALRPVVPTSTPSRDVIGWDVAKEMDVLRLHINDVVIVYREQCVAEWPQ